MTVPPKRSRCLLMRATITSASFSVQRNAEMWQNSSTVCNWGLLEVQSAVTKAVATYTFGQNVCGPQLQQRL